MRAYDYDDDLRLPEDDINDDIDLWYPISGDSPLDAFSTHEDQWEDDEDGNGYVDVPPEVWN